jgi:hypothetical protein
MALLNPAMKFVLGGALCAPPKTNFIATISNAKQINFCGRSSAERCFYHKKQHFYKTT